MRSDDGRTDLERLNDIARALGRPVASFFSDDDSTQRLLELLSMWSRLRTRADQEAVLEFVRDLTRDRDDDPEPKT